MRANWLCGVQVAVQINGRPLQEYDCEPTGEDTEKAVAAFIEITPGADFSLHVAVDAACPYKKDCLRVETSIDGTYAVCWSLPLTGAHASLDVMGVAERSGGRNLLRPFVFAEVETTDAVAKPEMFKTFSELGEIRVKLQWCTTTADVDESTESISKFASAAAKGVPEKALKGRAITQHAKLGAPKPSATGWVNFSYPHGKKPIAQYIFKYRTHRGLTAEGIIDRTPSPVPLEERDAVTLTQAELLQEVVRLRAEQEAAIKIKQEGSCRKRARSETLAASTPGSEDDDVTIASECSGRKKAKVAETVIDICDSDDDEED
ncbi:hypothetical protein LTR95_009617 [Oleoguttula sp. CCFEE 5521]